MYEQTRRHLVAMIDLLDRDGSHWAGTFQQAPDAYDQGQYQQCARIILSGSGGMGSFNDLLSGQTADGRGRFQWTSDARELNDQFGQLLSSLYDSADALRRVRAGNRKVAKILFALALAASFSGPGLAQGDEQDVVEIEGASVAAEVNGDEAALRRLVDDRFVCCSATRATSGTHELIQSALKMNLVGQAWDRRLDTCTAAGTVYLSIRYPTR